MVTTKKAEISPAEWQVMRIVWTLKEVTAQDIIDVMLRKTSWTESTIKTLIGRLVKKGYLAKNDKSRPYLYTALVTEELTMEEHEKQLIASFCAHHVGSVLTDVLSDTELTKSDIQRMIVMLTEKAKTAPEVVQCNCI